MCAKILCYGEIDLDTYLALPELPAVNRAAYVTQELENIGGGAANVAIWLANWGVPTRLAGHDLGDDAIGKRLREEFKHYPHLDTQYIVYHPDYRTPRCQCLVTPDGERTFIMHWLDDVRISPLTRKMLEGIQWLNLDLAGPIEPRLEAAKLAKAYDVSVLINDIYSLDHPLLPLVDIVVLSAAMIRTELPGTDPLEFGKQLQSTGHCEVFITDGGDPVYGILANGVIEIAPLPIDVVDTTGAGDIFKAGLLYGLADGLPLAQAVRWAVAGGSMMTTCEGTTAQLRSLADVQALVSRLQ